MFSQPTVLLLEESIQTAFLDAARLNDGKLYVLAASVSMLTTAHLAMDEIAATMKAKQIEVKDVSDMQFDEEPHADSDIACPFVFRELREQQDLANNAEYALKLIESGKTVLAVSHGTDLEGVTRRLVKLGFSESVLQDKLLVLEYLVENSRKIFAGE